jgi:glycerol kinase
MQIQADYANVPIIRPKMRETTALGSALAAGHAVGVIDIYKFKEDLAASAQTDTFYSKMCDDTREKLRAGWKKAVEKSRDWA